MTSCFVPDGYGFMNDKVVKTLTSLTKTSRLRRVTSAVLPTPPAPSTTTVFTSTVVDRGRLLPPPRRRPPPPLLRPPKYFFQPVFSDE